LPPELELLEMGELEVVVEGSHDVRRRARLRAQLAAGDRRLNSAWATQVREVVERDGVVGVGAENLAVQGGGVVVVALLYWAARRYATSRSSAFFDRARSRSACATGSGTGLAATAAEKRVLRGQDPGLGDLGQGARRHGEQQHEDGGEPLRDAAIDEEQRKPPEWEPGVPLEGQYGEQQQHRIHGDRDRPAPSRPESLFEVVPKKRAVPQQDDGANDGAGRQRGQEASGNGEEEQVVLPARGGKARHDARQGVANGGQEAEGTLLGLGQGKAEVGIREVRVEPNGLAEVLFRRVALALFEPPQASSHQCETDLFQTPDFPLDPEPANLLEESISLRGARLVDLAIGVPQGLEGVPHSRLNLSNVDDSLLRFGTEGERRQQGPGQEEGEARAHARPVPVVEWR
jgi:hypothetical protein